VGNVSNVIKEDTKLSIATTTDHQNISMHADQHPITVESVGGQETTTTAITGNPEITNKICGK